MTTLYDSGMLMVTKLDLLMKVNVLLSLQMGPILFHGSGMKKLPEFRTLILEELLLKSSHLVVFFDVAVSPLVEVLWLVVLATLSTSGTSLAWTLALLRPSLDTLVTSTPLHFPLPLSHHPKTNQSSSGRLVPYQQT